MKKEVSDYISKFIPIFSELNVDVTFLFVTENAYKKNIIDATEMVRSFLKRNNIHDYEKQEQNNPKLNINNKIMIPTVLISEDSKKFIETSVYKPNTKEGDPRLWFNGSKDYLTPDCILALISDGNKLFVVNLSNERIVNSLCNEEYVYLEINGINKINPVVSELLDKLKNIYEKGFVKAIGKGDPTVGETLEYYLGIPRNNLATPDYKGIELKTNRYKNKYRSNLFSKV